MSFEVAVTASLLLLWHILLGHFEAHTPKWRKIAKCALTIGLAVLVSWAAGRFWFYMFLVIAHIPAAIIHLWWLPKHGINGWTAEPKEKYYELRGWKV
jgi:fucose 4-O-acetylase-like acetyltransferase